VSFDGKPCETLFTEHPHFGDTMGQANSLQPTNWLRSYGWLWFLGAAVGVFWSAYLVTGTSPSPSAELLLQATLPFAISLWVLWDARALRCTPCYDFGMFIYFGWLLVVSAYVLWTRGWRGLLVLLMFLTLFMLPVFAGIVAWYVANRLAT
jgi:hypothetical protein